MVTPQLASRCLSRASGALQRTTALVGSLRGACPGTAALVEGKWEAAEAEGKEEAAEAEGKRVKVAVVEAVARAVAARAVVRRGDGGEAVAGGGGEHGPDCDTESGGARAARL